MRDYLEFYIDGKWVDPVSRVTFDVINPATEKANGRISMGSAEDVDSAVMAARRAFRTWSETSREERLALFRRLIAEYESRLDDLAAAITAEMGAPGYLARKAQAPIGLNHLKTAATVLEHFAFEEAVGLTRIIKEPVGVCSLITPWNWPLNQICCKVAPALAAGCVMVLKPSELAPFSAYIFAEIMAAAGVPAGVFNLVNGDGPTVGAALSRHPEVDMVSFTGSTRAGVEVARNAAPTVKRVHQELGGKSPNILLDDDSFAAGVSSGVISMMSNTGQSCNAPSRMLVPAGRMKEAAEIAAAAAQKLTVGDPTGPARVGPVISVSQWNKVQSLIQTGIEQGATLVTGGPGKPPALTTGFYVKPTVFADVTNDMTIARQEIFGPVLSILGYDSLEDALTIANDTEFGLAAYIWGTDQSKIEWLARRLRAGQIVVNGANVDMRAPFGGYKKSGNGREWGEHAFNEFLEIKAVLFPR